jgi:hypothetical protein
MISTSGSRSRYTSFHRMVGHERSELVFQDRGWTHTITPSQSGRHARWCSARPARAIYNRTARSASDRRLEAKSIPVGTRSWRIAS